MIKIHDIRKGERPSEGESVLVWVCGKWVSAHIKAEPTIDEGAWWIVQHWEKTSYGYSASPEGLYLQRGPVWIRPAELPSLEELQSQE